MSTHLAIRETAEHPAFAVTHSFSGRRWVLAKSDEEAVRALMRAHDLPLALAQLLASRGVVVQGRLNEVGRSHEGLTDLHYGYTWEKVAYKGQKSFDGAKVARLGVNAAVSVLVDPKTPARHAVLLD